MRINKKNLKIFSFAILILFIIALFKAELKMSSLYLDMTKNWTNFYINIDLLVEDIDTYIKDKWQGYAEINDLKKLVRQDYKYLKSRRYNFSNDELDDYLDIIQKIDFELDRLYKNKQKDKNINDSSYFFEPWLRIKLKQQKINFYRQEYNNLLKKYYNYIKEPSSYIIDKIYLRIDYFLPKRLL